VSLCDEALTRFALGDGSSAELESHVASCARCSADEPVLREVMARLRSDAAAPEPPPGLTARVLHAAEPLLAAHARAEAPFARVDWRRMGLAVAAALVLLPVVIVTDLSLLRALHAGLDYALPSALSLYVVATYAALLAALLGLTYGAIPLLAYRSAAPHWKENYAR
jgi:hypothetical protein